VIGSSIRALAVVIPVHNEEQLLSRCLQSVEVAVSHVRVPVAVYVVIDASTDGSASVARRHPFPVVKIDAGSVGVARSVGVTAALSLDPPMSPGGLGWRNRSVVMRRGQG
jgi:glycosyltransferase involved in cell wall biosynthesis